MSWEVMLGLYVAGAIATGIVLYLVAHLGIRWQRELPKIPIHESIEVLRQRLDESRAEMEELQETLFAARRTVEEGKHWQGWLDANEERLRTAKAKADTLRDIEEKLAASIDEQDKLSSQIKDLEIKRASLEVQLRGQEDIVSRIDALKDQESKLKSEVQSKTDKLHSMEERLTESQRVWERLTKKTDELDSKREQIRQEYASLRGTVSQMSAERDQLVEQIKNLRADKAAVAPPGAAPIEARTAALWESPVLAPFEQEQSESASEAQVLQAAMDRIHAAGLDFHERSVLAFHTGLKVARESPLLVLAGISGTGKSALPRRYAEAMGMHFLNVAVQPGWDSPLDLTGFYNHLEGRFKPTELTRALIQMDPIGAKAGKRWQGEWEKRQNLSSELLVVLLDEMNLARVEYYFSEFLSRLEIRRDVDINSEAQRRAAELQLEIGKGDGSEQPSIPLFVAENVLFVGTMNEDESTQSLSDKVIDRSNVMRFGRPSELLKGRRPEPAPRPSSLPYAAWAKWREDTAVIAPPDRRRLEGWIQECNEILDRVGRPFAHRTAQIMRAYVQQYPSLGSDKLATAMADQLEMQVLPRLRGIDPTIGQGAEALAETQALADRLGDSLLAQAIGRATERSEDQFVWSGANRPLDEASAASQP